MVPPTLTEIERLLEDVDKLASEPNMFADRARLARGLSVFIMCCLPGNFEEGVEVRFPGVPKLARCGQRAHAVAPQSDGIPDCNAAHHEVRHHLRRIRMYEVAV